MGNKDLKKLLLTLDEESHSAKTNEDLLLSVKKAANYTGEMKFNINIPIMFIGVSLIPLCLLLYCLFSGNNVLNLDNIYYTVGSLVLSSTIGIATYFCFSGASMISDLSKYINNKDTHQDNRIIQIATTSSGFVGYENIENQFQEFSRGNYSREMRQAYFVEKASKLTEKSFNLYRFHYVDSYQVPVTTTTSDGNGGTTTTTRMETRYNHYDRYGIVYDFNLVKNIKVMSDKKPNNSVDYNSSSIEFSKDFNIGASSEQEASKFLKPKVVEIIQEMQVLVNGLSIEINNNGLLCLSFSNSGMFTTKSNYSLSEPKLFLEELEGHTDLVRLEKVLACIVKLEKQLDNNFK